MSQNQVTGLRSSMGGFVLDHSAQVKFLYSGPISTSSPLQAEEIALRFLLEAILPKGFISEHILIVTDSTALMDKCNSAAIINGEANPLLQTLQNLPRVKVVHLNRRYNLEADRLAKEGLARNRLVAGWNC
ncbi:hypothetical protein POM88_021513 [Heracleum sosnowskyi]|nr:hypothetical protein POM88_021513 [Heracleum sosnowskyi]